MTGARFDLLEALAQTQLHGAKRYWKVPVPRPRFWLNPFNVAALLIERAYRKECERRVQAVKQGIMETEVSVPLEQVYYGGNN